MMGRVVVLGVFLVLAFWQIEASAQIQQVWVGVEGMT